MADFVSFETAKKLKAAGFPQPEPAVGQVWYNDLGFPSVCVRRLGEVETAGGVIQDAYEFAHLGGGARSTSNAESLRRAGNFAPAPTDIQRRYPRLRVEEALDHGTDQPTRDPDVWFAGPYNEPDTLFFDENPAEAAALAWIDRYGK